MKPIQPLPHWRAAAEILLWRHGCSLPIAAILFVLAAGLHVSVAEPGRAAVKAVGVELASVLAAGQRGVVAASTSSERQDLQAMQAVLRRSAAPDELVRKMAALAQAEHIVLAQSDYQQQVHSAIQVTQVHVTQPVSATYPQLRRYIESVLRTMPNATLDQIAARRDNVGQAQLEARLRWSFWIQSPAAAAGPSVETP